MSAKKNVQPTAYSIVAAKGWAHATGTWDVVINLKHLAHVKIVNNTLQGYFHTHPGYQTVALGTYGSTAEAKAALKTLYEQAVLAS